MPQLKKGGVRPLLRTVNNLATSPTASPPRRRLPDVDADASPISLSDATSDEDYDTAQAVDRQPRKRITLSSPASNEADSAAQQESTKAFKRKARSEDTVSGGEKGSKRKGKSDSSSTPADPEKPKLRRNLEEQEHDPPPASPNDDELTLFDQMHSSNSTTRKFAKRYRSRSAAQTSNVHAKPKKNEKKGKQTSASAEDSGLLRQMTSIRNIFSHSAKAYEQTERAVFRIPEIVPTSQPPKSGSKGFTAPQSKYLTESPNKKNKQTYFLPPKDFQYSVPSSAPPSSRAISLKDSASSNPSTPLGQAPEFDDPQVLLLESPDDSPVPPRIGAEVAHCPMCKVEVDREFLESFSGGNKLRLKAAMDFCVAHKQQNAQFSWMDSKYPAVDWEKFHKRLKKYDSRLRAILEQRRQSFFRDELTAKVASGQGRNALRNPEAEDVRSMRAVTGYYGSKGARRMMEHITNKFAEKIRKLAVKDQLFTEVGVGGYVQGVLVPELAVSLVMEDYNDCSEEKAREILAESAEMGDLVHAEEEETVEQRRDEILPVHDEDNHVTRSATTKKKGKASRTA